MRLIDADELITMEIHGFEFVPKDFINSAQTFELIHCEDCRYYKRDNGLFGWCDTHDNRMCDNDFCSYGKKKRG